MDVGVFMYAHGTRRSYASGCRCVRCRAANAAYVATPRVAAADVARHLHQLRALGVGTRQITAQTGVSRRVVLGVLHGTRRALRAATAARLMTARPVLAHGCTVPGTRSWRFIDSLSREGFTKRQLAFHLGATSQQLQLSHRLRVRSALAVATLYSRLAG